MTQRSTALKILIWSMLVLSFTGLFLSMWNRTSLGYAVVSMTISVLLIGGFVVIIWVRNKGKKPTREETEKSWKLAERHSQVYRTISGILIILFWGIPNFIFFIKEDALEHALLTVFFFALGSFLIIGGKAIARFEMKVMKLVVKEARK